jgi:hypothetical protein
MTDDPTGTESTDQNPAFARLAEELTELGYEPSDGPASAVTYTATDDSAAVALYPATEPPRAVLTNSSPDGGSDWEITFTGATPPATQLVILYAALNTADPADGLIAATAALGVAES